MDVSALTTGLLGAWGSFVERYAPALEDPAVQRSALIVASVVAGILLLALVAGIAWLPSQRKVVRTRRVRRIRRRVSESSQIAPKPAPEQTQVPTDEPRPPARNSSVALVATVWVVAGILVLFSFVALYAVTGTNQYCGETCHFSDPRVPVAVEQPHAPCIACHESGRVSGSISRIRMALSQASSSASVTLDAIAKPVEAKRCLRCHRTVATTTVTTERGLIVSHKEILAGGRTCSDCHPGTGHQEGILAVGMSRCTSCHDGVTASLACETCHVGGSPIAVASTSTKASSEFDYGPAVRVANRDCQRCHGAEKQCRDCHNGLVLPHPVEFVEGGHARMSAFGGKTRCFKCHSLAWCGSGKCHNGFSAHNETTWPLRHQSGTSDACGSCHIAWDGEGDFCKVCH